jgi:hypothetical protein
VTSTRRSTRSAGAVATVHPDVRTSRVSGRKAAVAARDISSRRTRRLRSNSSRGPPKRRCSSSTNDRASGVRISSPRSSLPNGLDVSCTVVHVLPRLPGGFGRKLGALTSLSGRLDGCVQSAEGSTRTLVRRLNSACSDWRDRMLHSVSRKSKPASDRAAEGGACG